MYKFLLSKVGQKWDEIYSQIVPRLNSTKPIFYIIDLDIIELDGVIQNTDGTLPTPTFRNGESTYYHKLWIDSDNIIQFIDANSTILPNCRCCTWTLNGKVIPFPK